MSVAAGWFKIAAPGTTFLATFVIGDITYFFQGSFGGTSIEPTDGVVALTYNDLQDLSNARNFSGVIGIRSIKITLASGNEMTGTLTNPIPHGYTVTGTGRWGNS